MKILKSLVHETIEENTAVTVGKFDGIHKGHELLTPLMFHLAFVQKKI